MFRSKFNSTSELISDWKNGDADGLRSYLGDINWAEELGNKDAEQAWLHMLSKVNDGVSQYIPKIRRRQNNNHQWTTKIVKRLVRQKQRRYNTYMQTRSPSDYDRYKATEKECKKAVRRAKKKFEAKIATNGNKRPFNSYIKSKTKSRVNVGPLKQGTDLITDNFEMAKILNNQFSSVFSNEDLVNIPDCPDNSKGNMIHDAVFNPDNVLIKIKSLKVSSSSGPDGLSSKFLADHADILATPLAMIYNRSMTTGIVPQGWRDAHVTPIFKNKGSKSKAENYRPISLTSIPCKIMESILRDHMVDYLTTHELVKSTQHGFIARRSCTTNLLDFLERCTSILDDEDPLDIVYLDFAKAFDKVPHQRLINKMKSLGIGGDTLRWTENWLKNRRQRTVLNGSFSEWLDVLSGVPQGSVLGPLLFVIFINDIDGCAERITTLLKFADDTKIGNRITSVTDQQNLQDCLDQLTNWADTWCMTFNTEKCKVLHVGRGNPRYTYKMNGVELEETEKERDIGVIVTKDLKPTQQCAEASRRASAVLTQITKAFLYRDRKVFLQLYKQFVRCHLEFAVPAWCPWSVGDIEILERVQRRAVNLIVGLKGRTYEEKMMELGITSLLERRKKMDLIQTFKIINGLDDVKSSTWFTLVGPNNVRQTRNTNCEKNIVGHRSRTEIRQNFFSNRVVASWNRLPEDIKMSRTLQQFKSKIKDLILTH